jgi:hypothetical protein
LPLAPAAALYACPARARAPRRRGAVLDLGWPNRAQVVPFVCPQVALPREPLELRRFARMVVESSLISPFPAACHALFQGECRGCLAKHHLPVDLMAYRSCPAERRVCRAVCLFQSAFLRRQGCAQRPAWLSRQVGPLGRDGPVLCLFHSALPLRLVKSPDSRQRLALLPLAKRQIRPALSRRRVLEAEYSLDPQS